MFKVEQITDKVTYEFWKNIGVSTSQKMSHDYTFNFQNTPGNITIAYKNKSKALKPELGFVQARITTDKKRITVEAKPFVRNLYWALAIGIFIVSILRMFNGGLVSGSVMLILGFLIFAYNRKVINAAIDDYKVILLSRDMA